MPYGDEKTRIRCIGRLGPTFDECFRVFFQAVKMLMASWLYAIFPLPRSQVSANFLFSSRCICFYLSKIGVEVHLFNQKKEYALLLFYAGKSVQRGEHGVHPQHPYHTLPALRISYEGKILREIKEIR